MDKYPERRKKTLDSNTTRFNACWQYFHPPRRLHNATFDSYSPKTKSQQEALATCQGYSMDKLQAGEGLFLVGTYGTGKTHLTIATARNLLENSPELFGVCYNDSSMLYDPNREDCQGLYC